MLANQSCSTRTRDLDSSPTRIQFFGDSDLEIQDSDLDLSVVINTIINSRLELGTNNFSIIPKTPKHQITIQNL